MTSHLAVRKHRENTTLYERIARKAAFAYDAGKPFTDSWLATQVGWPRNIVARVRLDVERDGWLERCGTTNGAHPQTLFRMRPALRQLLDMVPEGGIDHIDDEGA